MRAALASLPWVDSESIEVDSAKLQARFSVKDVEKFDEMAVITAIDAKGYPGAKKMSGPSKE